VDLSEGGYGVSLLNDCKYGHDIKDNVIRLTLLRSPTDPDPHADEGHHEFTYSLLPHAGDWRAQTVQRAYELNLPLLARFASSHEGNRPQSSSRVSADVPHVVVETVKRAEDSLLGRKGHDEQPAGVTQAHNEHLHCRALTGKDDCPLSSIYLRISPGIELQGDVHLWPFLLPPPVRNVAPHGRLTTDVTLTIDELVDPAAIVLLLARQLLILYQEFVDLGFVGPQHRLWTWYREPVGCGLCIPPPATGH